MTAATGSDRASPPVTDAVDAIVLDDVRTHLRGPRGVVRAVDGVSLDVAAGTTLCVVGESGSGKTILARSIMGLLPERGLARRTGRVLLEGRDIVPLSRSELRGLWGNTVAMVFQDPMTSLNPVMRVGTQVVEQIRRHTGADRAAAREQAIELLGSVGIPEPARRMRAYPHQLSGGMRQRVVIAMALSCRPSILIADEPTTALDVTVQRQVLRLLARLQRAHAMTTVLITHDLGVAAGQADEIAVMYAGQIVERAPTEVLFASPQMPYTQMLLEAIPRMDDPRGHRLTAIDGRPPDLTGEPTACRFADRCPRVQAICRDEPPPLAATGTPGHEARCWLPGPSARGANAVADGAVTRVAIGRGRV